MKKILVTGGAGFIGSHLVSLLLMDKHKVYVYDSFVQYIFPIDDSYVANMNYRLDYLIKKAEIIRGSTLNKDELRRAFISIKPDTIIHFAAMPLANLAITHSEEAFNSILKGTINILEILRDVSFVKHFIYISSSMIYGDFSENPQSESAFKSPKEIYGGLKLSGEFMVKAYAERYGIQYSIIRPSAVYGPTDNNKRVIQIFLEKAFRKEVIVAKNPKSTFLDFTYVEDTAEGIRLCALSSESFGKEFNITRGEGRSLMDALEIIRVHFPKIRIKISNKDSFHPKRGTLDISHAKGILNYSPRFNLETGIKKYIDFLSNQNIFS